MQPSLFATDRGRSAIANIDGGSRGNPGPAGYGASIALDDGEHIELKQSLGIVTNNIAEYEGLLAALRWSVANRVRHLHIKSDSELLVKQMTGQYRVKSPGLLPLYEEARALVRRIGDVRFEHVRRELNKEADRLANEAMDEAATANPGV